MCFGGALLAMWPKIGSHSSTETTTYRDDAKGVGGCWMRNDETNFWRCGLTWLGQRIVKLFFASNLTASAAGAPAEAHHTAANGLINKPPLPHFSRAFSFCFTTIQTSTHHTYTLVCTVCQKNASIEPCVHF